MRRRLRFSGALARPARRALEAIYASRVTDARLEFVVEPFALNDPGPHVTAAVDVVAEAGLDPTMGPLATTATGDLETIIDAVNALIRKSFAERATSVQLSIDTTDTPRREQLHGALDRIVADVEHDLGSTLTAMDRAQKQQAVQQLDERGAFLLRGSVDDVAETMGVSRVTLYAYLKAIES